ncbi:MAG: serine/threonine protein kinase [Clostridiales bacterium]|nr:serine/threonine protein kinase [Clostridiales bacterium]
MEDKRDIQTICLNCFATLDKSGFCFHCRRRRDDEGPLMNLPMRSVLGGRYLVSRALGRGGFGITYLAWDLLTSTRVAIKEFFPKGYATRQPMSTAVSVLRPEFVTPFNHWLKAFIQEARILMSIKHLHGTVKLLNFFESNNTAYIVMDYLEGQSLRKYLMARGGRISLRETLIILRPVLESLSILHQYGIIHKDISPENIQLVQGNMVKLLDFGAAMAYNSNMVKPYIVLKSGFSPVELYRPQQFEQGPWSDVYQMGATIYNCITGYLPADATVRYKQDLLPRPSKLGIKIPIAVENALMKSLAVLPKDRYTNIGEFIQMLYGEFMPPLRQTIR